MKKITIQIILAFLIIPLYAQWIPVNSGLDDYPPTALWPFAEDLVLGTYGGGIYKTADNGETWFSISGDLGNLFIHDLYGHASLTSMFVATEGGPYYTFDQVSYENCTSNGLTTSDVTFFYIGEDLISEDNIVGTNGGGIFTSEEYNGPWTPFNTGLSGNGLYINHLWNFDDNNLNYYVLATDNGTYIASESNPEWIETNNGLSGDALKAQRITGLGTFALLATHGGLFYNLDMGNFWTPLIPNEKLNTIFIVNSTSSSTGFLCFAFGVNGFYTEDFMTWLPVDLTGVQGEVTTAHANSTHVFIGATVEGKDSGGIYRKPIEEVIVGVEKKYDDERSLTLGQNFPNPTRGTTNISYCLDRPGWVKIYFFNVFGQKVMTLVNKYQENGSYRISFDASKLDEGYYFYSLLVDDVEISTKNITVVK